MVSRNNVTVVGGGDAGLLTALAIRQYNPELSIVVIDDFEAPQTDVGKSTYRAILKLLHDFLDIDEGEFLKHVKPIWKGSVYFKNWCDYEPFHVTFDDQTVRPDLDDPHFDEIRHYYYHTRDITTFGEQFVEQHYTPLVYSPIKNSYVQYPNMAYHLPIDRFNEFLRSLCDRRNIDLIDDRITDIETNEKGNWIQQLSGEEDVYCSNLYVDATGFTRLLMNELNSEFKTFDIPLDTALHATTDLNIEDIIPATVVETGEYGWFWQIDTIDSRDLGYVYASEYVSDDEALEEFESHREEQLRGVETYHFESGFHRNAWIGNCIANGNAQGFIEPLESTALTTHLEVAQQLSRIIATNQQMNTPKTRNTFNSYVRGAWNSIYDFISIHYRFADGDNRFWEDIQTIKLSDEVKRQINYYDQQKKNLEEHGAVYMIMLKMGVESSFYNDCDIEVSEVVKDRIQQHNEFRKDRVQACLTYEELYSSSLVDDFSRDLQEFWEAVGASRQSAN